MPYGTKRWQIVVSASATALACIALTAPAALAKHHGPPPPPPPPPAAGTGYDISYPQCSSGYPSGQAFGIVGVNGGLANDSNGCLASELTWAQGSPGLSSPQQPPTSLYINTADPGNGVADWPSPAKGTANGSTPYGSCDGSWSTACSYLYGEQRSTYSYGLVTGAGTTVNATTAPWWLDIETVNSWASSRNASNWAALNIAAIQGFVAGLQAAGAGGPIGFYSTASQWQAITGLTATTSAQYFPTSEPNWVAGASSLSGAQSNCSKSFTGAHVALAQFPSGSFDGDYACP
jgi:hypothetical protein